MPAAEVNVTQIQLACLEFCFGDSSTMSSTSQLSPSTMEQLLAGIMPPVLPVLTPVPASNESVVNQAADQVQLGQPGTTTQSQDAIQVATIIQSSLSGGPAAAQSGETATQPTGDGSGPAAIVDQSLQSIWQLQVGCLFFCVGTEQDQSAQQSQVLPASGGVAGSAVTASAVARIWQLQIGCLFWCWDTVEVQSASATILGGEADGGALANADGTSPTVGEPPLAGDGAPAVAAPPAAAQGAPVGGQAVAVAENGGAPSSAAAPLAPPVAPGPLGSPSDGGGPASPVLSPGAGGQTRSEALSLLMVGAAAQPLTAIPGGSAVNRAGPVPSLGRSPLAQAPARIGGPSGGVVALPVTGEIVTGGEGTAHVPSPHRGTYSQPAHVITIPASRARATSGGGIGLSPNPLLMALGAAVLVFVAALLISAYRQPTGRD